MSKRSKKYRVKLDDQVEKIPYDRSISLAVPTLIRMAMLTVALVIVVLYAKPCAHGVSTFVAPPVPDAQPVDPTDHMGPGVEISPDMTNEQRKAAIDEAMRKAREAAQATGAGSLSSGASSQAAGQGAATSSQSVDDGTGTASSSAQTPSN